MAQGEEYELKKRLCIKSMRIPLESDSLTSISTLCFSDSVSVIHFSAFHGSGSRFDSVPGAALIRMKFPLFPLALFLERYHFHWCLNLLSLLPNDASSFGLPLRTPDNRRGSFYS